LREGGVVLRKGYAVSAKIHQRSVFEKNGMIHPLIHGLTFFSSLLQRLKLQNMGYVFLDIVRS
jgi:hypothetical protein